MTQSLWPYRQTKTTAHFRDGNKQLSLRIKRNKTGRGATVYSKGDKMDVMLPVSWTINLEEVSIEFIEQREWP